MTSECYQRLGSQLVTGILTALLVNFHPSLRR